MGRNRFRDPRTGASYTWLANHHTEEEVKRTRAVEALEPAAAGWKRVKLIRQQSTATPLVMRLTGRQPAESQHQRFLEYQHLCLEQTIYFDHCDGESFEVLISSYEPKRVGVVRSARGERYVWEYTLEMERIRKL